MSSQRRQLEYYLEEFLVVVGRGPLELSLEGVHDGEMFVGGEVVVGGSARADRAMQRD